METVDEVRNLLESLKKNFQCTICLDLFSQPVSTKCNHQFCKSCFNELLKKKKKNQKADCPLCNTNVTKRSLQIENTKLVEMVSAVRDLCNAADDDCEVLDVPPMLSQRHRPNTTKKKQGNGKEEKRRNSLSFRDTTKENKTTLQYTKEKEIIKNETKPSKYNNSNITVSSENQLTSKSSTRRQRMSLCRRSISNEHQEKNNAVTNKNIRSGKERLSSSVKRKNSCHDKSVSVETDYVNTGNLAASSKQNTLLIKQKIPNSNTKTTVKSIIIHNNNNTNNTNTTTTKNENINSDKNQNIAQTDKTPSPTAPKASKRYRKEPSNEKQSQNLDSEEIVQPSVSSTSSSLEREILPKVSKCFNKSFKKRRSLTAPISTFVENKKQKTKNENWDDSNQTCIVKEKKKKKNSETKYKSVEIMCENHVSKETDTTNKNNLTAADMHKDKTFVENNNVNVQELEKTVKDTLLEISQNRTDPIELGNAQGDPQIESEQIADIVQGAEIASKSLSQVNSTNQNISNTKRNDSQPFSPKMKFAHNVDALQTVSLIHLPTKILVHQEPSTTKPLAFRTPPKTNETEKLEILWGSFDSPNQDRLLFSNLSFSSGQQNRTKTMIPKKLEKSLPSQNHSKSAEENKLSCSDCKIFNDVNLNKVTINSAKDQGNKSGSNEVLLLKSPPSLQRQQHKSLQNSNHTKETSNNVGSHNIKCVNQFKELRNAIEICEIPDDNNLGENKQDISVKDEKVLWREFESDNEDSLKSPSTSQQNSENIGENKQADISVKEKVLWGKSESNSEDLLKSPSTSRQNSGNKCISHKNINNINNNQTFESNFGLHSEDSVIPPTPTMPSKKRSVTSLSSTACMAIKSNDIIDSKSKINQIKADSKNCDISTRTDYTSSNFGDHKDVTTTTERLCEGNIICGDVDANVERLEQHQKQQQLYAEDDLSSTPPFTESDRQLCDMDALDEPQQHLEKSNSKMLTPQKVCNEEQQREENDEDVLMSYRGQHSNENNDNKLICKHQENVDINFDGFDDEGIDVYTNEEISQGGRKSQVVKKVENEQAANTEGSNQEIYENRLIEEIMFLEPKQKQQRKQEYIESYLQDQRNKEKHDANKKNKQLSKGINSSFERKNDEMHKDHNDEPREELLETEDWSTIDFIAERSSVVEVLKPPNTTNSPFKNKIPKLSPKDSFVDIDQHLDQLDAPQGPTKSTTKTTIEIQVVDNSADESENDEDDEAEQIKRPPKRPAKIKIKSPTAVAIKSSDDSDDDNEDEEIKRPSKRKSSLLNNSANKSSRNRRKIATVMYNDDCEEFKFSGSSDDEMFMKSALNNNKKIEKEAENKYQVSPSKNTWQRVTTSATQHNTPSSTAACFIKDIKILKEKLASPIDIEEVDVKRNPSFTSPEFVSNLRTTESTRDKYTRESPSNVHLKESLRNEHEKLPRNINTKESLESQPHTKESPIKLSLATPLKRESFTREISLSTPAAIKHIPVDHSTVLPGKYKQKITTQKRLEQEDCISTSSKGFFTNNRLKKRLTDSRNGFEQMTINKLQECNQKKSQPTTTKESMQVVPQKNTITPQIPHTTMKAPCYPVVMTTRLTKKGQNICKVAIGRMGGKVVGEYSDDVTHLLVATDENNALSKDFYTFKYLMALVSGIWIVNFKWIISSLKNKKLLDEVTFEAKGDPLYEQEHVPREYRIRKQRKLNPLFNGYRFCLLGTFQESQINKDQLVKLLRKLDADVACTLSEMVCSSSQVKTILICDSLNNLNQGELEVVSNYGSQTCHPDWIVECIINGRIEDQSNHYPSLQ